MDWVAGVTLAGWLGLALYGLWCALGWLAQRCGDSRLRTLGWAALFAWLIGR